MFGKMKIIINVIYAWCECDFSLIFFYLYTKITYLDGRFVISNNLW